MSYRTKQKSIESVERLPERVATITDINYMHAINLNVKANAYIQPVMDVSGLSLDDDGVLRYAGKDATEAVLREINGDIVPDISKINMPFIRYLFSIFKDTYEANKEYGCKAGSTIALYVPDILKKIRKSKQCNKADIISLIDQLRKLHNLYGIMKNIERQDCLGTMMPILVWEGYDGDTNTLRISSPYFGEVMKRIETDMLLTDSKNHQGARYSYLIHSAITSEKNKIAVEIVNIIVQTIERAGKNEPHISAWTIVDRVPQLKASLSKAGGNGEKNRILARAFGGALELLHTQTDLEMVYQGIEIPENVKANMPLIGRLESTVYRFPHNGKMIK